MKVFYSIASVQGPDNRKNTGNFFVNGAVRLPEYETLKYSSISIRELQLYAVTEEKDGKENTRIAALLGQYDSPEFFRHYTEFLEAAGGETDAEESNYALLSLTNGRLLAVMKGGAGAYRIRGGSTILLEPEETHVQDKLGAQVVPEVQDELGVQEQSGTSRNPAVLLDDSLPEDLYILCTAGLSKTLTKEEICRIAVETDRIQEIASALAAAAMDAGWKEPVTVLAVQRVS